MELLIIIEKYGNTTGILLLIDYCSITLIIYETQWNVFHQD